MELSSVAWQGSEFNVLDFLFDKHDSLQLLPDDNDSFNDSDILKDPSLLNLESWDDLDDAFSMFLSDGPEATEPSLSPPFYSSFNSPPPPNNETCISILEDQTNATYWNGSPGVLSTSSHDDRSSSSDVSDGGSPRSGYMPHSDHSYGGPRSTGGYSYGVLTEDEINVVNVADDSDMALEVDICADVEVTTSEIVQSESEDDDVLPFTIHDVKPRPAPRQTSRGSGRHNSSYPEIRLTLEEKRLMEIEGVVLPTRYPLTKEEEKELKRIRRKIRNKKSALDSRKRKKEYVSGLEDRVKACTAESNELKKKVTVLETHNRSLLSELRKLQALFGEPASRPTNTSTCLMILVLSFAFLLMPSLTSFSNPPLPASAVKGAGGDTSFGSNRQLPNMGFKTGSSVPCTTTDCLLPGSTRALLSQSKVIPDSPIPAKITKTDNISRLLDDDQYITDLHCKMARGSTENQDLTERRGRLDGKSWGLRKLRSVSSDPEDDPYHNSGYVKDDRIRASFTTIPPNISKTTPDDTPQRVNLPHRVM